MRLCKLLLAVVSATIIIAGALAGSVSARNFSFSSLTDRATWNRLNFIGGFGTVECEVVLRGSFHTRTLTKTVGTLIGLITEGVVTRCARGGATVNRGSLPWHRRYRGFTGTLPNITSVAETIAGAEFDVREPTFGAVCIITNATSTGTFTVSSGTVIERTLSSIDTCEDFSVIISGSTTNVESGTGPRLTITLI
ncbi:MAG: hypothetical protein ACJ76L_04555 [Conexibacter sp.]